MRTLPLLLFVFLFLFLTNRYLPYLFAPNHLSTSSSSSSVPNSPFLCPPSQYAHPYSPPGSDLPTRTRKLLQRASELQLCREAATIPPKLPVQQKAKFRRENEEVFCQIEAVTLGQAPIRQEGPKICMGGAPFCAL